MRPRVSLITLGVDHLQPGLQLALWPRASLAQDSVLPMGGRGTTDLCLAHNVTSKVEVDAVMAEAAAAGAGAGAVMFWGG